MPPKIKTTKEMILQSAFEITREKGFEACNARSIGALLGISTHPIFREYEGMEQLKTDLFIYVQAFYKRYLQEFPTIYNKLLTYGVASVEFAKNERNLFKLMMHSGAFHVDKTSDLVPKEFEFVIDSVIETNIIQKDKAKDIFTKVYIFTHGIASLVGANSLEISKEETIKLLVSAFEAFSYNDKKVEIYQ